MFDLVSTFGGLDIYLFDQIQRGRIRPGDRILDAGCGHGRNLVYFFRAGYDVCGADADPSSIAAVRELASRIAPSLPAENFRNEPVESLSFPDAHASVVICNAVLHFARDAAHFDAMLYECFRVLRPGGLFFCRLASSIGMADRMVALGDGRYRLPDGSARFLVDAERLAGFEAKLGARRIDPLKTTVVEDQRCMTTWVLRKGTSDGSDRSG